MLYNEMFNVYLSDTVLAIRLEHVWLKNKKNSYIVIPM